MKGKKPQNIRKEGKNPVSKKKKKKKMGKDNKASFSYIF